MITSEEIKRRLWDGANELRGSMDASRYKDYMLGLMFYKFLSDKTLTTFKETADLQGIKESDLIKEYKDAHEQYGEDLITTLQKILGYYVLPEHLYQTWLEDINEGTFEVQNITDGLHNFERTNAVKAGSDDFKGLFSSTTIVLTDTALGSNLNERSKNIQALILLFEDLNMVELQEGDILGDAYEYLIATNLGYRRDFITYVINLIGDVFISGNNSILMSSEAETSENLRQRSRLYHSGSLDANRYVMPYYEYRLGY